MPEVPYRIGADEYLVTLAPLYGEIKNIMEPLGTYRSHGGNHYMGRSIDDERLKVYMQRFEDSCDMLAKHAKKLGYAVFPDLWKKTNFNYVWPQRLLLAKKDIESLVPEGMGYILINEDEWGSCDPVQKRIFMPFVEKDGKYWGPPGDDNQAITELNRLRKTGAGFLIFWWTSFWFLDHYKDFSDYIISNYSCVLSNDRLIVYDLEV